MIINWAFLLKKIKMRTLARHKLIEKMHQLSQEKNDCIQCSGVCCTYQRNSMQIDQEEAKIIINYLTEENFLNKSLIQKLQENIKEFRLNKDLPTFKKIRRYYTCPFFKEGPKGCALPKEIKPLGCLAYNPQASNITNGENCFSDQKLLNELLSNLELLPTDPIPMAILKALKHDIN